jgi:ribulose-phosphate 3-epimerase
MDRNYKKSRILVMIKISPSILSADFAKLGEESRRVCACGADLLHVDVMDGHFVPNLTIGAPVVGCIKPYSTVPLDVHLMIDSPELLLDDFIKAGADIITVHAEATQKLGEIIKRLRATGVKPAIAIKPNTPAQVIEPYLKELDMVLVMTVEPGFGGQKLIESTLSKVTEIRQACNDLNLDMDIQVDGGITTENVSHVAKAGANVFVAGSAVFKAADMARAINDLRAGAQSGFDNI